MKRLLCATLLLQGIAAIAGAEEGYAYPYLTFRSAAGVSKSVAVESLEISFADGKLIARNATDEVTIELSGLDKMYFSAEPAGVADAFAPVGGAVTVYSMQGVDLGKFPSCADAVSRLPRGIYVIKNDGRNQKMVIR